MRQLITIGKKFNGFRHAHPVKMMLTDYDGSPEHPAVLSGTECYTPAPTWRNFLYRYRLCKCGDFALDWGSDYD